MENRKAFCIFKHGGNGSGPVHRDQNGFPVVFESREEAEQVIAKSVIERILQHFSQAHISSHDSLNVHDTIQEVNILENGTVVDCYGNQSGKSD